jgi:hypothetical protein
LTEYAGGDYGQVSIAAPGSSSGTTVPAIGLDQLHGNGFLTLVAGRAPAGPHEIALGARTLRGLGLRIGQRVEAGANGRTSPMRIVGSAVFAAFSVGGGSATDLGADAVASAPVLSQPSPPGCSGHVTCYNFFLLRYRPGTDLRAASSRLLAAVTRARCPRGLCLVTTDQRPSDIQDYTGVRGTPFVLGAVLALLAVGVMAHVLLTGVPLGLLADRWAWLVFANSAGVGSDTDIPVTLVLITIPVTLLLANLIAAGPGWTAARTRPALILRSE